MSTVPKILLSLLLATALSGAPAFAASATSAADIRCAAQACERLGFDSERLSRLDKAMEKVVADGRVPGLSYTLIRHGQVVEERHIGLANAEKAKPEAPDTIYRIYSMTKPVTGVAMMILFEQGKWRLDDPVTRYVPEFKDLKVMTGVDDQGKPILVPMKRPPTMRELMSHTAGFGYGLQDKLPVDKMFRERDVLNSTSLKDMIDKISGIPLMYQPGTSWYYSASVDIQGYIVEKLSGQTLGAFMSDNIFKPLKMTDTAFYTGPAKASRLAAVYIADEKTGKIAEAKALFGRSMPNYVTPPNAESGGGGLVSTLGDYTRFTKMLVNGGEMDGVRILNPRTVALMTTNVIPQSVLVSSNGVAPSRFNEAVGFGLDLMVVNDPLKAGSLEGKGDFSWGGAAGTWFWGDPTNDIVFVGMIQRLGGSGGDDLGPLARTLVYQALIHPEK